MVFQPKLPLVPAAFRNGPSASGMPLQAATTAPGAKHLLEVVAEAPVVPPVGIPPLLVHLDGGRIHCHHAGVHHQEAQHAQRKGCVHHHGHKGQGWPAAEAWLTLERRPRAGTLAENHQCDDPQCLMTGSSPQLASGQPPCRSGLACVRGWRHCNQGSSLGLSDVTAWCEGCLHDQGHSVSDQPSAGGARFVTERCIEGRQGTPHPLQWTSDLLWATMYHTESTGPFCSRP